MTQEHENVEIKYCPKDDGFRMDVEYFIPDAADAAYGLWVTTVGCQTVGSHMDYPLEGHASEYHFDTDGGRVLQEYQLVYITNGKGFMFVNKDEKRIVEAAKAEELAGNDEEMLPILGGKCEEILHRGGVNINKGSLLWLLPEQWHSYYPDKETGWTEYYIGFKGEIIERLIRQSFFKRHISVLDLGMNEELVSLYMRILELAQRRPPFLQQYLSGIVFHMLGLVMSCLKESEERGGVHNIQKAKAYMQEHICEQIDWSGLATDLGMSYSWFRRDFKRQTGMSPAKYFLKIKIQRAKELLLSSSMSIKEVYYYLGFNTAENFYQSFKRFSDGVTPFEYRKMMRGASCEG